MPDERDPGPASETFELQVTLPCDRRFAETARALAEQAARTAGCADARVRAFGDAVERAVRGHIEGAVDGATVPVVVRRADGPIEVLVDGRAFPLDS